MFTTRVMKVEPNMKETTENLKEFRINNTLLNTE